jgi:hypothetical protein
VPTPFPTVTFCNGNSIVTNASYQFAANILKENGLDQSMINMDNNYIYHYFISTAMLAAPYVNDTMRKTFGLPLNQIVLHCLYHVQSCNLDELEWYYGNLSLFYKVALI